MAVSVGTGDLFSGGAGTSGTGGTSASLAQGNVGATLDLSSLQSIQGHTIVDGLTSQEALNFATLVANTANKASTEAVSNVKSNTSKIALFAGGGLLLAVLAFFALKK